MCLYCPDHSGHLLFKLIAHHRRCRHVLMQEQTHKGHEGGLSSCQTTTPQRILHMRHNFIMKEIWFTAHRLLHALTDELLQKSTCHNITLRKTRSDWQPRKYHKHFHFSLFVCSMSCVQYSSFCCPQNGNSVKRNIYNTNIQNKAPHLNYCPFDTFDKWP